MLSRGSRILILTGIDDAKLHQRAVQLGAIGLVLKNKAPEVLMKALEKMHGGEVWLDRVTMANVLAELANPNHGNDLSESARIAYLTRREHEIISLVAQGLKNKQIAARLYISEITVRHHLTSVFGKLEVADRFELIIYAFKHGLSQLPAERGARTVARLAKGNDQHA
jgi:DNA-binding NarL/FixJ family response regulator